MRTQEEAWALTARPRPDHDRRFSLRGKEFTCYRHGQAHGLRVIEGEVALGCRKAAPGSLTYGPFVLPLYLPHSTSTLWYRKVGYLALEDRAGHAVRVLRRRFF